MNREQRRHPDKFPQADDRTGPDDAPPPDDAAVTDNPAFGMGGEDQTAYAGPTDQDVTRLTGTGTGGATESDERVPSHEATHRGNQPNS